MSEHIKSDNAALRFSDAKPRYLIIPGLIKISLSDGSVECYPGYKPDEAARAFWQAVSSEYREMLRWRAEHSSVMTVARDYKAE